LFCKANGCHEGSGRAQFLFLASQTHETMPTPGAYPAPAHPSLAHALDCWYNGLQSYWDVAPEVWRNLLTKLRITGDALDPEAASDHLADLLIEYGVHRYRLYVGPRLYGQIRLPHEGVWDGLTPAGLLIAERRLIPGAQIQVWESSTPLQPEQLAQAVVRATLHKVP
jgi:hypothetical protein